MENYISEKHLKGKRPINLAKSLDQILKEINSSATKGEIGKIIALYEQAKHVANNYLNNYQIIQMQKLEIMGYKEESFEENEKYIQGYKKFISQLPDYFDTVLTQAEIFR